MKTLIAIVMMLGVLAVAGFAQPACPASANAAFCIAQVSNAASQALPPLQNSSIAQGSFFAIYGNGLAAALSTCANAAHPSSPYFNCTWPPSYPLPTQVQGTTVNVTVNGTTVAAYVEFAVQITSTFAQVNAVLPSNTPVGTGTVTVSYNGGSSNAFPITVVPTTFGTFTYNSAGTGPASVSNPVTGALPNAFAPAKPGDYLTIWGTGLGPVDPSTEGSGPPTVTNLCATGSTCPVTVWVGTQQVPASGLLYAGRSGYTAIDQIDFQVPTGVQGCYVQVAVQTGSIISNVASIAVDPNGVACSDADGMSFGDISAAVNANGSAKVGAFSLLSNYLSLQVPLIGTLSWDNDTVNAEIGTFTKYGLEAFQGFALVPSVGNCTVSPFLQYPPPQDPILLSGQVTYLNAGTALSVQGPSGPSQSVPQNANGRGYSALVGGATINNLLNGGGTQPFYLEDAGWGTPSWVWGISSGNYTVSGTGGSDVGAFSAPLNVSSASSSFKWTNQIATGGTISRSTPLTINWTGGDPNGFVDITAVSSTLASGFTPAATTPGILVECIAPISTGSFTIPTWVLQSLPSTAASTATVPPGELLVGPASGAVPITPTPSGLDAAYIFYHFIQGSNVTWQ